MALTKIQITQLDYFTVARFFAVLYGIYGIFAGVYYALIETNSLLNGFFMGLGYPIFTALMGIVSGIITTFLFNTVVSISGGIEIYAEIGTLNKDHSEGEY